MSQSSNSPDSQALLQSMLERLKLQPEKERHAYAHTGEPLSLAPTRGTEGAGSTQNHKKEGDELTNGHVCGVSAKEFGGSSVDSSSSPKDGERHQSGHGFEHYRGHFFFPPQRDNSSMGVNKVSKNTILPQFSTASTGQHFLAQQKTDAGYKQDNTYGMNDKDHGLKHNVQDWSWGSNHFTAENGGFGDLSKWRAMQLTPHGSNSMTKRQQRSSENKARRWTQKLKQRWLERPSKKVKDDSKDFGRNLSSPQSHIINTSPQEAESTLPSSGTSKNPTVQSEDDSTDAFIRTSDDFQFGFSSVSLLEEIVSGQEWAKFLNAASSVASSDQRTPEQRLSSLDVTPKPNPNGLSTFATYQSGAFNRQWSFRGSESLPVYNIPANVSQVATQNSTAHSEVDHSEPMEQGQSQSHVQQKQSGLNPPRASYVERADILDDSPPTSRANRKRQYHSSAETSQMGWRQEGPQEHGEELQNSHEVVNGEEYNNSPFLSPNGSSASPVPSLLSPCGPALRSVLRHSASQNSDSSLESKRRRVEPNRRVHFAETVEEIPPVEVNLDTSDSEEEYGTELGSGSEEEVEEQEEGKAVPARRPALPAWIRALKKKNTSRKHR